MDLRRYRWHTGAELREVEPDEPLEPLFRDIGTDALAVFLRGELPVTQVTLAELDRVLGTLYAQVEQCFQALLRIGFSSRFT